MNANLLTSVVELLKENGKTLSDIKQVRGAHFAINIDDFIQLAADCEYSEYVPHDPQSDIVQLVADLTIIGDGWWICMTEYNRDEFGCETILDYFEMPERLTEFKKVHKLSSSSKHISLLRDFAVSQ